MNWKDDWDVLVASLMGLGMMMWFMRLYISI